MASRRDLAKSVWAVWLLGLSLVFSPALLAQAPQDDGHGHGTEDEQFDSRAYTKEQLDRIEYLFGQVVCACPRENWTKSLAGCPEGCALPQKIQVRRGVKAGKSDEEILAEQVQVHGSQALARTPAEGFAGFYLYVLPFVALVIFLAVVVILLRALTRKSAVAIQETSRPVPTQAATGGDKKWGERIEAELKEMD